MGPRRRRGLILSEIEATGESLVVDPENDKATVINEMATIVWLLCNGTRDEDAVSAEVIDHLCDDRVGVEDIRREVARVIQEMEREGLLER